MIKVFRLLLQNIDGAFFVFDKDLRYVIAGGANLTDFGFKREQLEGRLVSEVLEEEIAERMSRHFQDALGGFNSKFEHRGRHGLVCETTVRPLRDETGRIMYGMATSRDISAQRRHESDLRRRITIDQLTQLTTKAAAVSMIEELAEKKRLASVLLIDLDLFKQINDTHGHHVGDLVLREVAYRLQRSIRYADLASRIGGDEFLIVLSEADLETGKAAAQRIIEAVRRPIQVDGRNLTIGCSIGVAELQPGDSPEALLSRADAEMYSCKRVHHQTIKKKGQGTVG